MKKPLIGITLDEEETKTYSKYPWYAARKNYSESIEKAGGVCIFLPNNSDEIDYYLKLIDGLVVTGGDFDIDPSLMAKELPPKKLKLKREELILSSILQKKL